MSATETVTLTRPATKATAGERAPAEAEPVVIPKTLGPVTLVREIGKGGMGAVWLGRDEMLSRDVAVKFLLNMIRAEDDPDFATFLEGARAAAALRHKGLNAVLNADVVNGVPFIVMELVEGPTLAQVLARAGALSLAAARVILTAACEAVGELHDHDIVHRDIKPSNILIAADGTPVLTDFGLACSRPVVGFGAKVEAVSGTPTYMAPEMFDRSVSARSDVYALGIMAYEVLTGEVPFDGSLDEVRRAHRERDLPIEKIRAVDPSLADVVLRATNKNPMFRLKTARHMLHALEDAFAGMDPMRCARARGESELSAILTRWTTGQASLSPGTTASAVEGTYYDRLGTLVTKRRSGEGSGSAHAPDAELVDRVPGGVVCVRCATPLGGQPVTGRCPGCLLLVRLTLEPSGVVPPGPMNASSQGAPLPTAAPPAGEPAPPRADRAPKDASFFGSVRRFWREFFAD